MIVENINDPNDPIVLTPMEEIFKNSTDFKHKQMKWIDYEQFDNVLVKDKDLIEKISDVAKRAFIGLKGNSYGRIDIRMNS